MRTFAWLASTALALSGCSLIVPGPGHLKPTADSGSQTLDAGPQGDGGLRPDAGPGGSGDAALDAGSPECGDGHLDPGEACDDGNTVSGDLCPSDCSLAPVQVESGGAFACTLLSDRRVFCWGDNAYGELGPGASGAISAEPVEVTGVPASVYISGGASHACAVAGDGHVSCWGSNRYGQLGNGQTTDSAVPTPVMVEGLADAVAVQAGAFHSCALRSGGQVVCWGSNDSGQLGDGLMRNSPTPVSVMGLPGSAVSLAAGVGQTCAIVTGHGAFCWGDNSNGELGTGGAIPGPTSATAVGPVAGLDGVTPTEIDGHGYSMCVRGDTGEVLCWGLNDTGELSDATTASSSSTAVPVSGVNAMRVDSYYQSCAILSGSGSVKCWGNNNHGQLGNGSTISSASPVTTTFVSGATRIATGYDFTCAIASDQLFCWGNNGSGQLGNSMTTDRTTRVAVMATW